MIARRENTKDRLVEAAVELLRAAPGATLKIVLLNKALFYLDLCALRDRGETLTGSPYIALDQGPVVAKYKTRLVDELIERGFATQRDDGETREKPVTLTRKAPKAKLLDEYALEKAREIAKYFSKLTSKKASEISHQNPGWMIAYAEGRGRGNPPKPINMRIAMQEFAGTDPWLESEADPEFESAVAEAEKGPRIPW